MNRVLISLDGVDPHRRDEDSALVRIIERHVSDLAGGASLCRSDRVALILAHRLGQGSVGIEAIAREPGPAPRAFQRRLAREGTSLRGVLRVHRMRGAQTRLVEPGARIADVAHLMGFSDATAFGRACRGWFGQTPKGKPRPRSPWPRARKPGADARRMAQIIWFLPRIIVV